MFGIGEAVKSMRDGLAVTRAGWNGADMYLFIVTDSRLTSEYYVGTSRVECEGSDFVMMKTADNRFVPWTCSQTDLLAIDWSIAHVSI